MSPRRPTSILLACLLLAAAPADPARRAVERGKLALAARQYAAAADAMEDAYRLDRNPLWAANAGFARMMAGQQDRAIELLSEALADPTLPAEPRDKAHERLGKASACRALLARAERSRDGGDLAAAARAFDEAAGLVPIGAYLIAAGEAYERAGLLEQASQRLRAALAQADLSEVQRRDASDALVRVAAASAKHQARADAEAARPKDRPVTPPEPPGPVAGWALIGTGSAALAFGVIALVVTDQTNQEFADRVDGDTFAGTYDDAQALQSEARTWWTLGVVSSAAGLAATAAGLVLVLTHDDGPTTEGRVNVTAVPLTGGGLVTLGGPF